MSDALKVSVIVPCRNEVRSLRPFLASLREQDTRGFEVEILIADGESDDGSAESLAREAESDRRVRVIPNPGRIVSTGLNAAIRAARGDVIIRMDVHTEYRRDYIRSCVRCLLSTDAQNVGGAARTRDAATVLGKALAAAYASPFACGGARFHISGFEGYVDTVPYGCWRKETLFALGLFDETLVRNQDDELNLRMQLAGMKIWQSASIVSWYTPRQSVSGLFRQYMQYGFWKVAVVRKHGRTASMRHWVPSLFVLSNAVLLLAWVSAWLGAHASLLGWAVVLEATLLGAYALAAGAATLSARHEARSGVVLLPLIFATYHISYGLGFLAGAVYWPFSRPESAAGSRLFASLTR